MLILSLISLVVVLT
nr:hypothetical protein [Leuconostoc garlicum]